MRLRKVLVTGVVLSAALALALAWRVADLASTEPVVRVLVYARGEPWAPAFGIGATLVAGFVAFPISIVTLANAAVFGPALGLLYSAIGMALSGSIVFFGGAHLGKKTGVQFIRARWPNVAGAIKNRGVAVVVALRIVPLTPFTVTNLLLGATGFTFVDFAVGSLIGMAPTQLIVSIIGDRIGTLLRRPTVTEACLLALSLVGYLGLIFFAQKFARLLQRRLPTGRS